MLPIIFLKRCQIFSGFGEFSFFHTLADIPVDKGTLGVHEIEFVIKARPGFGNGGGVAEHGHASVNGGKFAAWYADGPRNC